AALAEGCAFAGPAIVQQSDTTTLVEPGWSGVVDRAGNLILTQQNSPRLRGFREGEGPPQGVEGSWRNRQMPMTPPSPQRLGYKPRDGDTSPASLGRDASWSGAHGAASALPWLGG